MQEEPGASAAFVAMAYCLVMLDALPMWLLCCDASMMRGCWLGGGA
jgi:hypothetical protein